MSQDSWDGNPTDPTSGRAESGPPTSGEVAPPQSGQESANQPLNAPNFSRGTPSSQSRGVGPESVAQSSGGPDSSREMTPNQTSGPVPGGAGQTTGGDGYGREPSAQQLNPGSGSLDSGSPQLHGTATDPGSAFVSGNSPWPEHSPTQSWTQPVAPTQPAQQRRRTGTIGVLATAIVLSALVGGGTAFGVAHYLSPQTSSTPTRTAEAATGGGQVRVIQGSTSAPDWAITAAHASKSAVSIQVAAGRGSSSGSGVILDKAGHIVTNNHVVEGGSQGQILVQVGVRRFGATIVGTDPYSDLAVLKLDNPSSDLTPITFADSDKLTVGDPVMAIGNPLGLSGTVTTGIVSALNRPVSTGSEQQAVVTNAIQTSAAINPGNSGGALVNANGELVGINTAIASLGSNQGGQSGNIGIGFAIESNLVRTITQQIIQKGSADHAWLGVSAEDSAAETSGSLIVGARVTQVTQDSPAAKAGLAVGDLITSISGRPVSSLESLVAVVRAQDIGEEVEVGYIRSGKENSVRIALAESPRVR